MNSKMLALYGLTWNPFTHNLPTEALHVTPRLESFCWRVQQLAGGVAGHTARCQPRRDQPATGQHRRLLPRDGRTLRGRIAPA